MTSWQGRAALVLRIGLAGIFIAAAWIKLREPWALFAMAIDSYQLLPDWAVMFTARTLPWGEMALGLLLLSGFFPRISASLTSALLLTFFAALVRSYVKGMQIDCGCFGSGAPLSALTLLRDGSFLAASLALTWLAFRKAQPRPAPVPAVAAVG